MAVRGRPRKNQTMDTLAVRLPDDLVSRVDAYVAGIKTEYPMLNVSRADAIRQLLAAGLEAEERRLAAKEANA